MHQKAATDPGLCAESCTGGLTPANEVVGSSAAGLNDPDGVPGQVVATTGGVPIGADASGAFGVPPEADATFEVLWPNPTVHIGGAVYPWYTVFGVPAGISVRSGPVRFRVPSYNAVGLNWVERLNTFPVVTDYYKFVTRGYVSAFEIEVGALTVSARHSALPNVVVPVQFGPECAASQLYRSHL
jgi:hypothetical protein